MKPEKKEKMVRVNTRIFASQDKYIKDRAKKENVSEGEITRELLAKSINSNELKAKK